MKPSYRHLKALPFFTAVLTFWIISVCVQIIDEIGGSKLLLAILSLELFFNWFAILLASRNCTGVKSASLVSLKINDKSEWANDVNKMMYKDNLEGFNHRFGNQNYMPHNYPLYDKDFENVEKLWYCQKCCLNSREQCQHCPVCNKCVVGRDHHCFILGACIGKQNMKHFIIFQVYTSLACLYAHILLCSHMNLYNESWYIIFQHLFPISFTKWLIGQEYSTNVIEILLMNVTGTVSLFSFVFSILYLYDFIADNDQMLKKTASGKSRPIYKGSYGSALLNLLFPVTLLNYILSFYIKKNYN